MSTERKSKRESIKYVVLESFLIVLGVVLAFIINEWRENQKLAKHVDQVLTTIKEELTANRDAVQSSLQYHQQLKDTLIIFANTPGTRGQYPPIKLFNRGFISPAVIFSTSWNAAMATDAFSNMDYEYVLLISEIYEKQKKYEKQAESVAPIIYSEIYNKGTAGIVKNYLNLISIIFTFIYKETELIEQYNNTL